MCFWRSKTKKTRLMLKKYMNSTTSTTITLQSSRPTISQFWNSLSLCKRIGSRNVRISRIQASWRIRRIQIAQLQIFPLKNHFSGRKSLPLLKSILLQKRGANSKHLSKLKRNILLIYCHSPIQTTQAWYH